jgi:small-conductance mechanosensitive channel
MDTHIFPEEIRNRLFQIGSTILLILLYFVFRAIIKRLVNRHARLNSIERSRELYIKKLINILILILILVLIAGIWEISFKGLSLGFASVFTVIGVALFAHWSILSNLTASIILYFFFPYKIGGKIAVMEGNTTITGTILDITLFYIHIRTDQNKEITLPNSLALQKVIEYD